MTDAPAPPASPPDRALWAEGLRRSYRGVQAVAGVAIRLHPGEVVALMGPNGAGKTTIYRLLTGAERPDHGRIVIDGIDVTHLPTHVRARCGLSYLPQAPSAFRGLSVADNILLALENHDPDRSRHARRLDALLAELELTELRHRKPAELSGGQRKRCEIARLLAADPRYVLLDEPFASLDPLGIAIVQRQVAQLAARGIGVLITDHNVRATLAICDRGIVIVGGTILREGPAQGLLDDPALRPVWLGAGFVM